MATDNPLLNLLNNFLRKSEYYLDKRDLYLQLNSNPDYPSVKSITDTFDYFGIENGIANVPKTSLNQLPDDFLAIIKKNNDNIIYQVHKSQKSVTLYYISGLKDSIKPSKFIDIWNGTLNAIEKDERILNNKQLLDYTNPLLLIISFVLLITLYTLYNFQPIALTYKYWRIVN